MDLSATHYSIRILIPLEDYEELTSKEQPEDSASDFTLYGVETLIGRFLMQT
jgi:hypothetical protein